MNRDTQAQIEALKEKQLALASKVSEENRGLTDAEQLEIFAIERQIAALLERDAD